MDVNKVKLDIGGFLGFCDLNGVEAVQTEKVQELEEYVRLCQDSANNGVELVADSIYDRLIEILRQVNPESELCKYIWEDSVDEPDDTDELFRSNPMYSIMTVKSFECDEILAFRSRLVDNKPFDMHVSVKLNGHGIRLKYRNGAFFNARSRARASAGRDITPQLKVSLEMQGVDFLVSAEALALAEVRGEWVLPFENLDKARTFNEDIKSAFSAVASLGRASATNEECGLLRFVAYQFIADGVTFSSKEDEYKYLESLGFEVPLNWVITDMTKENLIEDLKQIVDDCEAEVTPEEGLGYSYYTDGLVASINDADYFRFVGDDGNHYKYGNIALKVGYWKQDMYTGYVQTICWMKGKTKLSPIAIVAEEPDIIEFADLGNHAYVLDLKQIANLKELGVVTASGNKVRRVPLYEPNNILALDAYKGSIINFRYGGEAGVVPCFENGVSLVDGRVKQLLSDDDFDDYDVYEREYLMMEESNEEA